MVGLSCTNAAIGTTFNDVVEQAHSTVRPVTPAQATMISGSVDLAKLNGKTHVAYSSDDTTQALTGANPTEILRLQLAALDVTGTARAVYVHISLWYDCEFSDPVQLAQS
jgi:anthranilate phosphoribosyltransferase